MMPEGMREKAWSSPGTLDYMGEGELENRVCMLSRFSHVQFFATLWTVALQVPLSMGFSRQEYCSGFPFPSPGDLPDPGIEPTTPAYPTLADGFFTTVPPGKPSLLPWFSLF